MPKPYITAYVRQELKDRLADLARQHGAPSISRFIEGMIEQAIEDLEAENAKISNRNVQSIR